MGDWWQALTGDLQIFYAIAFISSFFLLVQIALLAFGIGADIDIDVGNEDPSSGFLSIRTLTAFSFAFGWTGVLMKQADRSTAASVGVAIAAGLAVFLAVGLLWRSFAKLGESGSVHYQSAVGTHGTVYLTVAANRSKPGKVEVMVQGRMRVVNALTESDENLPAQTAITVVGVVDPSTVLVAPH